MMIDSIRLIGGDSVVICPFVFSCNLESCDAILKRQLSSTLGCRQKRVASMANKQKPWWYIVFSRKHRQHRWASEELFVPWARKPPVAEFCWVWSLECWVAWQLKDREPWPMIHQVWICSNLNTYIFPSSRNAICVCVQYMFDLRFIWWQMYIAFSLLTWVFPKQFVNQVMFEGGKRWLPKTPKRHKTSISRQCVSSMFTQHWTPILGLGNLEMNS